MAGTAGRRCLACTGMAAAVCLLGSSRAFTAPQPPARAGAGAAATVSATLPGVEAPRAAAGWALSALRGALGLAAAAACGARGAALARTRRRAAESDELPRRAALLGAGAAAGLPLQAALAVVAPADLPERINADPYELIGMENPDDSKTDKKEFYMKKDYKQDTYQVLKHMKISASLDKGTPRMERWNKRIKEEMDDWVALYRRQDAVVGRQSYYSLYSAVNTLASHFTSYGPKFPFPNKRRPRFYELVNTTEKYLEKNK